MIWLCIATVLEYDCPENQNPARVKIATAKTHGQRGVRIIQWAANNIATKKYRNGGTCHAAKMTENVMKK